MPKTIKELEHELKAEIDQLRQEIETLKGESEVIEQITPNQITKENNFKRFNKLYNEY